MTAEIDLPGLAACPFCGGEAKFIRKGTSKKSCIVACEDCGARLETNEVWSSGQAWNTRAAISQERGEKGQRHDR